jgi:hypothetical protein
MNDLVYALRNYCSVEALEVYEFLMLRLGVTTGKRSVTPNAEPFLGEVS